MFFYIFNDYFADFAYLSGQKEGISNDKHMKDQSHPIRKTVPIYKKVGIIEVGIEGRGQTCFETIFTKICDIGITFVHLHTETKTKRK